MRIAHLTPPSATYLIPERSTWPADVTVEDVLVRVDVPLATDPARLTIKDLVYVDAAVTAERAGFDAIFVNTVADYGVDLIRGTTALPTAGAGESSIAAALSAAPSFGIVTVWPSSTQIYYDRVLAATGTAASCTGTRYVLEEPELGEHGGGAGAMAAAHDPGSPIAARVLATALRTVEEDGAASIVLGCSCMSRLTPMLREALDVPVVDPRHTGFEATVAAARAPRAEVAVNPDTTARIVAAVDVWQQLGDSVTSAWDEECGDACAIA
ncbi:aspartate/glutamate racemase family protein [Nocardioides humi]|uniref:Allantoin racemase n=1 Tax=Nocardioides humi TaxID=449461 RepID=A0ABN2AHF6_9ACTN|nr:aspartate/glutamate racemase family protein [Nocardioides humi]